ncbi:putative ATPase [Paraburkholderia sp. BL23I1N1]|uniref:ATP-binding protein n=1 Tax=Paraburkholderia sp. BL23I1N1 TaxID=1938802 RepID=UPI000E75EEB1|nr:winged helix-turn-helix domain-containing protein [Paraburkholderia sp. BL23I1N1]RKE35705.1 putative ATPase [Paraburkholderia sp. BL23I1N1]
MIQIGQLQISIEHREIRSHGESVRLGSRAFDVLELLIAAEGALVSKEEIMRHVWPNTIVEENNLQVHIAAIRKALGADRGRIVTVPGRGYRMAVKSAAPAGIADAKEGVFTALLSNSNTHNLPLYASPLVGRQCAVADVLANIEAAQIVTLVGSGGIGKTRLAIEAARQMLPRLTDGVAFVSLAPVSEPRFALDALAMALGMKISSTGLSLAQIAHEIKGKRLLIVLDNCEHVIDAAASMAEALAAAGETMRVLATSREALRVRDEIVYPVLSLEVPSPENPGDDVLQMSAVQLFLARARAADPQFSSDERSVFLTGEVCRHLDGIPLAIELAAARAAILGLDVLAARLDDRLRILSGGYRTALPRHQTLKATLDWSYRLLDNSERAILRWLGMFVDAFTFDSANYVGAQLGLTQTEVLNALSGLVSKSLVIRADGSASPRYRLLETTRAYVLQRLDDNGERGAAALAHAKSFCERFKRVRHELMVTSLQDDLADFTREIGNVRAALDWAFSATGDHGVGIELASIVVPYLFDLALVDECRSRARVALDAARDANTSSFPPEARLRLTTSWAAALVYTQGPTPQTMEAWSEVLALAVAAGHAGFETRALCGLRHSYQAAGEARQALVVARRFEALAGQFTDPTHSLIGRRMEGVALHYAGEQRMARRNLEEMLSAWVPADHRWNTIGFRFDQAIVARALFARVTWALGDTAGAMRLAGEALEAALQHDFELVTCYVLGDVFVPLALLTGDRAAAERGLEMLKSTSSRVSLSIWHTCCACYDEYLYSLSGEEPPSLAQFRNALDELRHIDFLAQLTMLLCQFARALMRAEQYTEALTVIDEALQHCEDTGERWYYAELCRAKGDVMRALHRDADAAAWFTSALDSARRQSASVLALRAASSLTRLWIEQDRLGEARRLLSRALARLSRYPADPDVQNGRALLSELEARIAAVGERDVWLACIGA